VASVDLFAEHWLAHFECRSSRWVFYVLCRLRQYAMKPMTVQPATTWQGNMKTPADTKTLSISFHELKRMGMQSDSAR